MADLNQILKLLEEQGNSIIGRSLLSIGARAFQLGQQAQARARGVATALDPKAKKGTQEPPDTTARGMRPGAMRLAAGTWDYYNREADRPQTRRAIYQDAQQMDAECVEVSTGLNVISTDVCTSDDGDEVTYRAKSDDNNLQRIIDAVNERTELPMLTKSKVRSFKKMGDLFEQKVFDGKGLLWDVRTMPASSMVRVETEEGRLEGYAQIDSGDSVLDQWDPWEMMHLRNNSESGLRYGRPLIWAARKAWKQFSMLEDGTVVMVLERAPQRLVHRFLVSDDETEKAKQIAEYKLANLRTHSWDTDRSTLTASYDALDRGDIIIPLNPAAGDAQLLDKIGITTLDGQSNIPEVMAANEYWQRKIVTVMQVPPAYLGIESQVKNRSMLAFQEVEFGRMLRQTQATFARHYKFNIYGLQFKMLGMKVPADAYWVEFPDTSRADNKINAEILKTQASAAVLLSKLGLPLDLFLVNFLGWSDQDALKVADLSGAPSTESQGLGKRKQKEILDDLHAKVIPDVETARYLGDLMERLDESARYALATQDPVRA